MFVTRATGWLTHEDMPDGTTLVYACNEFNKLIRLVMLWRCDIGA